MSTFASKIGVGFAFYIIRYIFGSVSYFIITRSRKLLKFELDTISF